MSVLGKKYRAVADKVEAGRLYDIGQAVTLVKQTSYAKFDSTPRRTATSTVESNFA